MSSVTVTTEGARLATVRKSTTSGGEITNDGCEAVQPDYDVYWKHLTTNIYGSNILACFFWLTRSRSGFSAPPLRLSNRGIEKMPQSNFCILKCRRNSMEPGCNANLFVSMSALLWCRNVSVK
ncbi:predicted protein [Botrytis cinerea T4]|uniref:Uncharacterized protein n=1 Tax=Botryotinia fuckeliana (strain T4) TaxID=999810 RepID=G2XQ05_BOTF4|nr:predicted protein [Botrytis cinerea T4]